MPRKVELKMSLVPLKGSLAQVGARIPHSPVGESSRKRSMRRGTPPPMMAALTRAAKVEVESWGEGWVRTCAGGKERGSGDGSKYAEGQGDGAEGCAYCFDSKVDDAFGSKDAI